MERQAIENLLEIYRQALLEEDIDRVQSLLQPASTLAQGNIQPRTSRQDDNGTFPTLTAFRAQLSETSRSRTVQALALQEVTIATDHRSASFLEVESCLEPATLDQQTRVFRTTFQLARTAGGAGVRFHIVSVARQGPLVQVTTPGLLVAGPPLSVAVRSPSAAFRLAAVELTVPETAVVQRITADGDDASGSFTAPSGQQLHSLRVHAMSADGEGLDFDHRYRLHLAREGIAQRVVGTGPTRFFAVTAAADGTVWAGGDGGAQLYRFRGDATRADRVDMLLEEDPSRTFRKFV